MTTQDRSPISFAVNVARLPKTGLPVSFDADEKQRKELAAAHDLLEVKNLHVDLDVVGWKKGGVKLTGRVRAEIVQACTVTLEPVVGTVDEQVSSIFLPVGSRLAQPYNVIDGEIVLDAEGEDAPELFSGDTVDVGAMAEEFFTLGIDPYPRKAGAEIVQSAADDAEERGPLFEKLEALRKKL